MQPPPRGCVLKLIVGVHLECIIFAAASARLCVETFSSYLFYLYAYVQPPPRGCVLKHYLELLINLKILAAASARLCVET